MADIDVIGPPRDPSRYLRHPDPPPGHPGPPADATARQVWLLLTLHPRLQAEFAVPDAASAPKMLEAVRQRLGILSLARTIDMDTGRTDP